MRILSPLSAAFAALLIAAPTTAALAMTDAECSATFASADQNKDGLLNDAEGRRYHAALRVAQKPIADGNLTQADFLSHCKAGLFTTASVQPGAPLSGANSFTEVQAQNRAAAAGFVSVSKLTKDDNGVWRGTAMDGAKSVTIAVDFKGNVVAN